MRLLYLSYYASLGALMPYLPVYFHSLGHAGSSIGFLGAVKPLTTFLVAPLWGILSDQSNNPVSILQFTFVTSLLLQLLVGMNSNLHYLIATVFLAAMLNAPVKSLIDNIVMSKLTSEEDKHQFGRMRLWGQIGFGAGSSLVGYLLSALPAAADDDSNGRSYSTNTAAATRTAVNNRALSAIVSRMRPLKGYEWAFVAHAILSIPVIFCIHAFRPEKSTHAAVEPPKNKKQITGDVNEEKSTNVKEGWRLLSHNSDALIFFFLVFVIGTSSGCIENFAYVRVREVGGTGNNMGILRLVSSLAGAPMFWYSGPITEALGTDVVLVLSLLAYVVRFFNYAWMRHAYHALPAEALRGLTFALFWSSGSMYAHKISPPGMKATMLLIMNAMYGGLGQSLGAIVGGKLQSKFGTVNTFVYSGIFDACFVCALVVYLASVKERAFSTSNVVYKTDCQLKSTKKE
jgi:predicted MFS family arabinose efflux permease